VVERQRRERVLQVPEEWKETKAQMMGGAGGDEMSLGDGGALVRDAAESHRLRPMIVDPCLGPDVCHVTMG
jgi:hypothetical protein